MERPEAKYFCNKCGYVGPNSQHENCSYFACTSLEYQYIEKLELRIRLAEGNAARNQETTHLVMERLAAKDQQIALLREAATNLVNFILHPCWDADETIPELVAMQTVLAATEGEK